MIRNTYSSMYPTSRVLEEETGIFQKKDRTIVQCTVSICWSPIAIWQIVDIPPISPCLKLPWPYCLVPPHHRSCQRPGCFPSPGWFQWFQLPATLNLLEWGGLVIFWNNCLTGHAKKSTQPTSHVQSSRCQTASFESANAFTFKGASLRPSSTKTVNITW